MIFEECTGSDSTVKHAIDEVVRGENLSEAKMVDVMQAIMEGRVTPAQIGSFLTALRIKGETVDEITGAARALRAKAVPLCFHTRKTKIGGDEINIEEEIIVDTCGTGGDGANTFNVSTATAFVVAGGGVKVAKHGNRAVSSRCGSADVLEELGVKLDLSPSEVERCVHEVGIGFFYAPLFHGAMKHAAGPRREIGIRTVFNLLGPLTNPAGATVQVLGVYAPDLTVKMATVLGRLGGREAFVVCGEGGFDEISICGPTTIAHLKHGAVGIFKLNPKDYGLLQAHPDSIRGGSSQDNALIIREILEGRKGPRRDMILLNAAAAFVAAGLDNDFQEGIERARDSIDSGRSREKLDHLIAFSRSCSSWRCE